MSSPPPIDFPSSDLEDVEMDGPPQDGSTEEQSMSIAPQRLFLEGTPSAAGTPARQRYEATSPLTGIAARRAVGLSTPRRQPRTPLFACTWQHIRVRIKPFTDISKADGSFHFRSVFTLVNMCGTCCTYSAPT
ncbi:hypothetical protein EDD15DRAFT_2262138 [Pisolithus albus]|nr:hypothetical protein EDD15DRAFT_2262138 [Pisolithus albus]